MEQGWLESSSAGSASSPRCSQPSGPRDGGSQAPQRLEARLRSWELVGGLAQICTSERALWLAEPGKPGVLFRGSCGGAGRGRESLNQGHD